MTDLVCLHPAPVRWIPPRGRAVREDLASVRTPVRLRHAPRDAFEPVAMPERSMTGAPAKGVIRDADGLWQPMRRLQKGLMDGDVTADDLVGSLTGDAPVQEIDGSFRRTPVAAPGPMPKRINAHHFTYPSTRGDDLDGTLAEAREVYLDGRGRAAAGVALWLDRNVRIVGDGKGGGQAYRRFVPVLGLMVSPSSFNPSKHGRRFWRTPYDGNFHCAHGLLCQPDRGAEMDAFASEIGWGEDGDDTDAEELAAAIGSGDWSEDVLEAVVAIHGHEVSTRFLEWFGAHSLADALPNADRLVPLARRLMDIAAFAPVGLAHGDDAHAAVRAMSDAIKASGATAEARKGPWVLEAALDRIHMLSARPNVAPEDVDALGGLAP